MAIQLSPRFLSMVIHDLRTPLNVICLTLRLIEKAAPKDNPDLNEDFDVVQENVTQLERMLALLTDYCRLIDNPEGLRGDSFDPRRLLVEVVGEFSSRLPAGAESIPCTVRPNCPQEVQLDPNRVRLALQHALNNAWAAAEGSPVRVELKGASERLVVEVIVDRPPPANVHPKTLGPNDYERLFGTMQERRGLDLAIAARISELFGGSVRLELREGQSTAIVFDWPVRLNTPSSGPDTSRK
jgi:signal transduction histidine kinase